MSQSDEWRHVGIQLPSHPCADSSALGYTLIHMRMYIHGHPYILLRELLDEHTGALRSTKARWEWFDKFKSLRSRRFFANPAAKKTPKSEPEVA